MPPAVKTRSPTRFSKIGSDVRRCVRARRQSLDERSLRDAARRISQTIPGNRSVRIGGGGALFRPQERDRAALSPHFERAAAAAVRPIGTRQDLAAAGGTLS